MKWNLFAPIVFGLLLAGQVPALGQDCEPLKPSRAIDTEIKNNTEADANVLLKSLGSGSLKNEYSRIEKNQAFQNVDEIHRWDSFIYVVCTILKASNLSPDEKIDRFTKLYTLKQEGPPQATSQHSDATEHFNVGDTVKINSGMWGRSEPYFDQPGAAPIKAMLQPGIIGKILVVLPLKEDRSTSTHKCPQCDETRLNYAYLISVDHFADKGPLWIHHDLQDPARSWYISLSKPRQ